jgi:hypothetical protein
VRADYGAAAAGLKWTPTARAAITLPCTVVCLSESVCVYSSLSMLARACVRPTQQYFRNTLQWECLRTSLTQAVRNESVLYHVL